jgi:hypothetical protein
MEQPKRAVIGVQVVIWMAHKFRAQLNKLDDHVALIFGACQRQRSQIIIIDLRKVIRNMKNMPMKEPTTMVAAPWLIK